jgi:hypothetical protein
MNVNMPVKELITITGKWAASDVFRRGVALPSDRSHGNRGATGYDSTATTGLRAALRYFTSPLSLVLQPVPLSRFRERLASNFAIGPSTLATLTFSAVGSQQATWSGATGRHLRFNVTSLGGATGFSIAGVICSTGVTG